ncbi:DUF3885 domain-containing protein [Deinococcus sp.]|uniref:DUF3885 domain-containing protein n=1 Tax=Deinococcus sp. TaxID=47478 RepID=UPI0025C44753|nr:DUF3885 domain-containing protein [Deinococcus sp.]
MSLFERLDEVFGPALAAPLFYAHSPALRFALSGGETRVAQFLQAIDRARTVLDAAFAGAEELTVILQLWDETPENHQQPGKLWQKAGASLRELGITPPTPEIRALSRPDEITRVFFAFRLPNARLPELLWGVLAADFGFSASLSARLFLAAPELGMLACPYDSRGMDIIGPNAARLAQLYAEFNGWLLDYDRAQMDTFFGAAP